MSEHTSTSEADTPPPEPPREAKSTVDGAGALLRAAEHLDGQTLEVLGTTDFDEEPTVTISVESTGAFAPEFLLSFDPSAARELARELERQAALAERWAEHRAEQHESPDD